MIQDGSWSFSELEMNVLSWLPVCHSPTTNRAP